MPSKFKLWRGRITQDTKAHPLGIIPQSVTQHNNKQPTWAKCLKSGGKTMDNVLCDVVWIRFVGRGVLNGK